MFQDIWSVCQYQNIQTIIDSAGTARDNGSGSGVKQNFKVCKCCILFQ